MENQFMFYSLTLVALVALGIGGRAYIRSGRSEVDADASGTNSKPYEPMSCGTKIQRQKKKSDFE